MERPGLRARRLQTLDECHAGRPGVGETGLEERPLLLPIGQHSENKGTETKKPTFAGGLSQAKPSSDEEQGGRP